MATTTTAQQQQIAAGAPPSASPKRPIDDEVEFVSSQPVKKRRPTCQIDRKPGQQTARFMLPPPQTNTQQMAPSSATVPQVDQGIGAFSTNEVPAAPVADMSLEDGRVSVSLFENFKFPPPHGISEPQRQRPSEEVSPRSIPQSISHTALQVSALPQSASQTTLSSTARLDQISCLDLNGSPVAAPRLNMAPDFSRNTHTQPDSFVGGISGPISIQSPVAPPVGALNSQNAIPFTMYSTGNLVTLPQHQHTPHLSTSDANFSSSPFAGARMTTSGYSSKGSPASPGGVFQDYRQAGFTYCPPSHSGGNVPLTFATTTAVSGSHSGTSHRANCLVCAITHSGAKATRPVYQNRSFQPHTGNSSYHDHPQNASVPGYMASNTTKLPLHSAGGADGRAAMPPPLGPTSSALQQRQLSSQPTPTPDPPRNKKFAQNLLVDVAETVEDIFPYADVATRHGVAPSRVAEALSGVILLPLLRCATDKRRAGPLAQERMREYREVKQSWPGGTSSSRGTHLGVAELVQVATLKDCLQTGGG